MSYDHPSTEHASMEGQARGGETSEFSPLDAARVEFTQAKMAAGWTMRGQLLTHPADPDLWLTTNLLTSEVIVSSKLLGQLEADPAAATMLELMRADQERRKRSGTR